MHQLNFNEIELRAPAQAASPTSQAGAAKARGSVSGQCRRILRALTYADFTREELCELLGIPQHVLCARLRELEEPGHWRPALAAWPPLIRKTARRRLSSQGVPVVVYEITAEGREALQERKNQ